MSGEEKRWGGKFKLVENTMGGGYKTYSGMELVGPGEQWKVIFQIDSKEIAIKALDDRYASTIVSQVDIVF